MRHMVDARIGGALVGDILDDQHNVVLARILSGDGGGAGMQDAFAAGGE